MKVDTDPKALAALIVADMKEKRKSFGVGLTQCDELVPHKEGNPTRSTVGFPKTSEYFDYFMK